MKLIRGSYAYIVGLFILGVSSVAAIVAFFFGLFAYSGEPNPLLSDFGSNVESGIVTMIASTVLVVFTGFCSAYTLWSALKKNSLDRPMRLVAVVLFLYAAVLAVLTFIYRVDESVVVKVMRYLRCLPPVCLGILLLFMTNGKHFLKIPAMIVAALCGALTFTGYGMYRILIYDGASSNAVRGYVGFFLFLFALFLFFSGLCCFIGGCEKRSDGR